MSKTSPNGTQYLDWTDDNTNTDTRKRFANEYKGNTSISTLIAKMVAKNEPMIEGQYGEMIYPVKDSVKDEIGINLKTAYDELDKITSYDSDTIRSMEKVLNNALYSDSRLRNNKNSVDMTEPLRSRYE